MLCYKSTPYLMIFGTFIINFEYFFFLYGPTQATGQLVESDTIPRPRDHVAMKILGSVV